MKNNYKNSVNNRVNLHRNIRKLLSDYRLNQEQIDDPHIERLIQAFSLIAARIDKKLADSYEVFTRSLFEVMFPQYLKPFPACTVVSFEERK